MLQQERRRDPYPHTWELPAGTAIMTLLLAVVGAQVGRSLANWFAGADWTWPRGRTLLSSIPAILTGNATAGLTPPPVPAASSAAVIGWILAVELVLFAVVVTGTLLALRRWGPVRMRGMASPADAETVLGLSRLRRVRHIIRPDLYPERSRDASQPAAPAIDYPALDAVPAGDVNHQVSGSAGGSPDSSDAGWEVIRSRLQPSGRFPGPPHAPSPTYPPTPRS